MRFREFIRKKIVYIAGIPLILVCVSEIYFRGCTHYCEPYFDKQTGIIKREKNTEGIYKTHYTSTGYFRINNEGWNSHRNYYKRSFNDSRDGTRAKLRIAVVGHSNIEGLRIPADKTLSKILEDEMNKQGMGTEVYTFGFESMHLAQALHVSRYVVSEFKPDILIIGTLLDNFLTGHTNKPYFLSLDINEDGDIREIIPEKYSQNTDSPLSGLYFIKTVKYADIRIREYLGRNNTSDSGSEGEKKESKIEWSTVDTTLQTETVKGLHYILREFGKMVSGSTSPNLQIFFIDFPVVFSSYNYEFNFNPDGNDMHHEQICKEIKAADFRVIHLENILSNDYRIHHHKFDFPNDDHFNQYAHKIIGEALSAYLLTNAFN